ncbi:diguanylate cyclase [Microvirga alba]|uniref:Diguanylate cyclase DosC n=1 Tax=Microvirga alba TaxID=2791025 RepID=A0A931BPE4_9HYPH|nr:diguanylate cyclase [Microvirga alba]MBF9232158.1 diguanylate cyclase [Microvirga alba]
MEKTHPPIATRVDDILGSASLGTRRTVALVVEDAADELVAIFYSTLLQDEEAARFLSHSIVNERLHHSLRRWLTDLFVAQIADDVTLFSDRQKTIGDVHARIRIPIHLVMQGANLLKVALFQRLETTPLQRDDLWAALVYAGGLIDLAIEIMSQAFVRSTASRVQTDEAYRLFSLGQDITLERESQRAALMEWSQSVLFSLYGTEQEAKLASISASEFGLWLHHRAGVMFQGSATLEHIERSMRSIDSDLLPQIAAARSGSRSELPGLLEKLQAAIAEMKFLLADMFQSVAAIENGRDPLTQTLNRRFLPSILSREIAIATKNDTQFSVLMIDVDHFKQINDQWGHPAGDAVLRQIADVVLETCRLSDFVFRYGGEEFLVALVEMDSDAAFQIAERIRGAIEARDFISPDNTRLPVTVSVGIATFDGHPDFSYLIKAADHALYRAKQMGRNRCMISESARMDRVG